MKDGWIKVAAATPALKVADAVYNTQEIIELMQKADAEGVKLLVFPELAITGATCGDLYLQRPLLEGALDGLEKLLAASEGRDMLTVVGLPLAVDGKLYSAAAVLLDGTILGVVPKGQSTDRCFAPAPEEMIEITLLEQEVPFGTDLIFSCEDLPEFRLGVEIGEDLWQPQPASTALALAGATVIACPSAVCETVGAGEYRRLLVRSQSARSFCGYVLAEAGENESTTDMVFAGHNLIAENGVLLAESQPFTQGLTISDLDVDRLEGERRRGSFAPAFTEEYVRIPFDLPLKDTVLTRVIDSNPFVPSENTAQRFESILNIQAHALKKRIAHAWCQKAVIGISGGLDSCLALLVAVRAMDLLGRPHSDVLAVTMPCFGTTSRTRSNAEILCSELGVTFECVNIAESVRLHLRDIGHDENNHNVTYENAQARERTQVLMDIANRENGMVIGTGDLSELVLGWATYNGDHMSMYGVNGAIPKTLVRHLVRHAAQTARSEALSAVLIDILDTPVSPELLPARDGEIAQKTEDLVGPYELHDFFLYYMLRYGFAPGKIFRMALAAFGDAYDRETLLKWLKNCYRRFFIQQFKRSCLPDGPRVGSVGVSPRGDLRMPSDACSTLWLKEIDELK